MCSKWCGLRRPIQLGLRRRGPPRGQGQKTRLCHTNNSRAFYGKYRYLCSKLCGKLCILLQTFKYV